MAAPANKTQKKKLIREMLRKILGGYFQKLGSIYSLEYYIVNNGETYNGDITPATTTELVELLEERDRLALDFDYLCIIVQKYYYEGKKREWDERADEIEIPGKAFGDLMAYGRTKIEVGMDEIQIP